MTHAHPAGAATVLVTGTGTWGGVLTVKKSQSRPKGAANDMGGGT
ncbi:hypothetical protein AVEN_69892-1, partial [Araneus ventricosus]